MGLSVELEPLEQGEDISAIKYFVVPLSISKHRKIAEAAEHLFDPEAPYETARIVAVALNTCFNVRGTISSIALHRMPDKDYALLGCGSDFEAMRKASSIANNRIMQVTLRQQADNSTWLAKCTPLPEQWRSVLLAMLAERDRRDAENG